MANELQEFNIKVFNKLGRYKYIEDERKFVTDKSFELTDDVSYGDGLKRSYLVTRLQGAVNNHTVIIDDVEELFEYLKNNIE